MKEPADVEQINKKTLRRLLDAADRGDLEAAGACFVPDYVDHDPPAARRSGETSLQGALAAFREFQTAFPDTRHTIHELIAAFHGKPGSDVRLILDLSLLIRTDYGPVSFVRTLDFPIGGSAQEAG